MPYSVKGIFEISGYSTHQSKVQWKTGVKELFHFYALRLFSIIYEFNKAGLITLNATFKLQHHVLLS